MKQDLRMPAWIGPRDEGQRVAFRRGYRQGLTGKPQPEKGDSFLALHAGWCVGAEEREAREEARERRRRKRGGS